MKPENDGITIFQGKDQVKDYVALMVRHRLYLETKGLKFRTSTGNYIRDLIGSKTKNKLKLLSEYEDWMENQGFTFKRYTEPVKLTLLQEEKHEIQNHIRRKQL